MLGKRPKAHHTTPKSKAIPPLYLLRAGERCPSCGEATNVYTLAASGLYDALDADTFADFIVITSVEYLPPRLLKLFQDRCPDWYFDREGSGAPYLMNHCRACSGKLSDHYIHGDVGAAFFPTSPEECRNILLAAES